MDFLLDSHSLTHREGEQFADAAVEGVDVEIQLSHAGWGRFVQWNRSGSDHSFRWIHPYTNLMEYSPPDSNMARRIQGYLVHNPEVAYSWKANGIKNHLVHVRSGKEKWVEDDLHRENLEVECALKGNAKEDSPGKVRSVGTVNSAEVHSHKEKVAVGRASMVIERAERA